MWCGGIYFSIGGDLESNEFVFEKMFKSVNEILNMRVLFFGNNATVVLLVMRRRAEEEITSLLRFEAMKSLENSYTLLN